MTASNVLGVNATLIAAGGVQKMLSGLQDGRVKVALDSYTMASETTGSTIKMFGTLPKGANVIAVLLSVSAAVSSLTVSIGDSASATRYASAHTGLQTSLVPIVCLANPLYVVGTTTGDNQILLTTGGASLASGGTIVGAVLYSLD